MIKITKDQPKWNVECVRYLNLCVKEKRSWNIVDFRKHMLNAGITVKHFDRIQEELRQDGLYANL